MSEINRVAGGHKATLNNPRVSEGAKDNSRRQLDELEESGQLEEGRAQAQDGEKNFNNVMGGFKATVNNPNVGDEAKEHARDQLHQHDVSMR